jgi:hypothetical protein
MMSSQKSEALSKKKALTEAMKSGQKSRADIIPSRSTPVEEVRIKPHFRADLYKSIGRPVRFARASTPDMPVYLSDGKEIAEAIFRATAQQTDNVLFVYGARATSVASVVMASILEGRATGALTQATFALWPDVKGQRQPARSLLVDVEDILGITSVSATDYQKKDRWHHPALAHDEAHVAGMRVRDLQSYTQGKTNITRPTLLELTPIFTPQAKGPRPYAKEADQIFARIRHYKIVARGKFHEDIIGDPEKTPYGMYLLPPGKLADLQRCLRQPRFETHGIDALVVDLTRLPLRHLEKRWEGLFGHLLTAVDQMTKRPGMVVVTDSPFVFNKVEALMKERARNARPSRKFPEFRGIHLRPQGYFHTDGPQPRQPLSRIDYEIDLKDYSLNELRDRILDAKKELERAGEEEAANAMGRALRLLRRVAALPTGYNEALDILNVLHPLNDDRHDKAIRERWFSSLALHPFNVALPKMSISGQDPRKILAAIKACLKDWENDTPVSVKLRSVLTKAVEANQDFILALPNSDTVNIFRLSKLGQTMPIRVVDERSLPMALSDRSADVLYVVQPSTDTLNDILFRRDCPKRVCIISDAPSLRLWISALRPIANLKGFEFARDRVTAIVDKLRSRQFNFNFAPYDEEADLVFRASDDSGAEDVIDFTQGDSDEAAYTGTVIRIVTERDRRILRYRPESRVIRRTADEITPFELAPSKSLKPGDEIVVIDHRLVRLLADARARSPSLTILLREYHKAVERQCRTINGANPRDKAREVVARMRRIEPKFSEDEIQNVQRWLSVNEHTVDDPNAPPNAPKTKKRFRIFAKAIGLPDEMVDIFWDGAIMNTRSLRISSGLLSHESIVQFIMDPDGRLLRAGEGERLAKLWPAILQAVDVVETADPETADPRAKATAAADRALTPTA